MKVMLNSFHMNGLIHKYRVGRYTQAPTEIIWELSVEQLRTSISATVSE